MVHKRLLIAPFLALALAANASAPRQFALHSATSEVTAKVAFFGLSSKSMKFPKMKGAVTIAPGAPERTTIDVTFDATALEAPDQTTLRRLRSKKFFWVDRHPTVRFVGKSLKLVSPTRGTVSGNLTARGVTRPETLDVRFENDPGKLALGQAVNFTGSTTIDRRHYGMTSYQVVVGNQVEIKMRARMTPR